MEVRSYIATLTACSEHPLLTEVLQYIDETQKTLYQRSFVNVLQLLNRLMNDDADKIAFDTGYLRRVIKNFSGEIEEQGRQRQILEAILRYAVTHHQLTAAKIPQLITLNRDSPALAPTVLVHTRAAIALYNSVKADLEYPAKLANVELEIGRLATVLHLFEGVPDIATLAAVICDFQLHYAGSVIFLSQPANDSPEKRFIIQPYTALLLQLLKRNPDENDEIAYALRSRKALHRCIELYLGLVTERENFRVSIAQLNNYRNIYWTSHYSPVEAKFFLQRCKSTLLPTEAFIRTTMDKCLTKEDIELLNRADPSIGKMRKTMQEHAWRQGQVYQSVKQTEKLVKQLIALVKKHGRDSTEDPNLNQQDAKTLLQNKKNQHQAVTNLILNWLEKPGFSQNFYVQLFGGYLIHLLRNGGARSNLLSFSTIRDYAASPIVPFITIFADLALLKMDEERLIAKLNNVAELMPATKGSRLYYLAMYIQQLELVEGFYASAIDKRGKSAKVSANVVSVPQMERLLQYLHAAGEHYTDAILVLCLGFYSGTRRSEAEYIRVSDFEMLAAADGTEISVKIVPTKARDLKSQVGTRTIHLNAFWPKQWLSLLVQKLQLARAAGVSKTDLVFDNSVGKQFAFISQLLRAYLADETFVFHSLRHSFVCWQYYRLVLQPRINQNTVAHLHCFAHEYFSAQTCQAVRKKLGLPAVTRKSVYALCALVGHSDPQITFGSYLHLRDLYLYLLMSDGLSIKQKALSRLVNRAKLDPTLLRQFPAGAISYSTPYDEHTLNILPSPGLVNYQQLRLNHQQLQQMAILPGLQQLEHGLRLIGKIKVDEHTAVEEGGSRIKIDGAWLKNLHAACNEVQRDYPKRSARLPLIPFVARSKSQLRADKNISASRMIFERLLANAQKLLDEELFDDAGIVHALEAMTGLLIKQHWSIQFTEPAPLVSFLELTKKLLPDRIQVTATLYDPDIGLQEPGEDNMYERWFMALAQFDIKPELSSMQPVYKPHYWNKRLRRGLVWLYFVVIDDENYSSDSVCFDMTIPSKRSSTVMQFMHFLMVACKTRLMIKSGAEFAQHSQKIK